MFRQFPGAPQGGERRSVSAKRRTPAPQSDNLEFIFPDEPRRPDDGSDEEATPVVADVEALPEADEAADALVDGTEARAGSPSPSFDGVEEGADTAETAEDPVDGAKERGNDAALVAQAGEDHLPPEGPTTIDDDEPEPATDAAWAHELEALQVPEPARASRVLHVEDVMARSYGFTTIARSLLVLVALHAFLALSVRLAPGFATAWLSRIPLAGALVAREPSLTSRVELRNVAGTFQELRNARRVFVITGEAVNRSPASIERIEVEGTLYGNDGRVEHKVVNAGNRTTLRDLSEKEIALLQRLDPRRVVAPGESSTFLIVFLEPPRSVREFSSRVLNVRPSRRLARLDDPGQLAPAHDPAQGAAHPPRRSAG